MQAREVLTRWYDSFAAGDYETTLDCLADDVEYHELPDWPGRSGAGIYRGKEQIVAWYGEILAEWESLRSEPGEITDLGGGQVLAEETWRARGRQSGVDVEMSAATLFTFRDGKIARVRYFRSREEALEAA